jgi:hypothetical protein
MKVLAGILAFRDQKPGFVGFDGSVPGENAKIEDEQ